MKAVTFALLFFSLGISHAANAQVMPEKVQPRIQPNLKMAPKDARPFTALPRIEHKVTGGKARAISVKAAGVPVARLPGAKRISFAQWREMKRIPKTGLFLVETEYLPASFEKQLRKEGYTLKPDGTLRDKEGLVALFVTYEMFQIEGNRQGKRSSGGLAMRLANSAVVAAEAGNPYPFSMYSWSMRWRYRGGFCRDYRAWTNAEAWGPLQGGARPHTRIQYMETRAYIGSRHDRDSCYNCDHESSYVRWKIGCFWPAHGGASGWHYANWKDGGFSATRTWSWSH